MSSRLRTRQEIADIINGVIDKHPTITSQARLVDAVMTVPGFTIREKTRDAVQRTISYVMAADERVSPTTIYLKPIEIVLGVDLRPNSAKRPNSRTDIDKTKAASLNHKRGGIGQPVYNSIMGAKGVRYVEIMPIAERVGPDTASYAIIFSGDDMSPAINAGDFIWIDETVEPRPGQKVVIEPSDPLNERERYIGYLVGLIDDYWVVRTEKEQYELPRKDWPKARKILYIEPN